MAGQVTLDSSKTAEMLSAIKFFVEGSFNDIIVAGFNAIKRGGENHYVEDFSAKFMTFQNKWNDMYLPIFNSYYKNLEEFGIVSDALNAKQTDTAVKAEEVDPIQDAGFTEALKL